MFYQASPTKKGNDGNDGDFMKSFEIWSEEREWLRRMERD